jgi:HAD superfamily phosphoserine phosphatase-like hydrolase
VTRELFEQTAREMPLTPGARETVVELRKAGYRVGVVSDSFRLAAEVVRRRVFADFSIAHLLRFRRGRATGRILLAPAMIHPGGCPHHTHCKVNVMLHLMNRMGIGPDRVLAVGDGENDVCMLQAAGTSVAFRPTRERVRAAARHVVEGALSDALAVLLPPRNGCPVSVSV